MFLLFLNNWTKIKLTEQKSKAKVPYGGVGPHEDL